MLFGRCFLSSRISEKSEANVAVLDGLQEEVLSVKKAVPELLLFADMARNLRVDTEKKDRSMEMELSFVKLRDVSFDGAMAAVNKELSPARVDCAALCWNLGKALSKLNTLDTDLEESLKVVIE